MPGAPEKSCHIPKYQHKVLNFPESCDKLTTRNQQQDRGRLPHAIYDGEICCLACSIT
jgi:hypothetical protein